MTTPPTSPPNGPTAQASPGDGPAHAGTAPSPRTGPPFVNVVRAEMFKSLRKRRVYVLGFLWWVLLPALTVLVGYIVRTNLGDSFLDDGGTVAEAVQQIASPFGVARIALTGPAFLSPTFYIIVVALVAALLIGEERSQNMWKSVLVAQPARLAVLWGKIAVAWILLGVLLAGALASGALFGAIGTLFLPTDGSGAWGSLVGLAAQQWFHGLAAILFAFLMIFLVRNIALGIVMVFFIPPLLEGLYTVYRATVGFQPLTRFNAFFQGLRLRETLENLPYYFFTTNLYFPARRPVTQILDAFGGSASDLQDTPFADLIGGSVTLPSSAWVMGGYAIAFAAFLTLLFLRRDVD